MANINAFEKGLISGFTTSLDESPWGLRPIDDVANSTPSTRSEAEGTGEGTDYITGQSGTRYGQLKNDRFAQWQTMAMHTLLSRAVGNDWDTALNNGSEALQAHDNMAWRASQAANMEARGMDPVGIKPWIISGDQKDLVTGVGEMVVKVPDPSTPNGFKNIRMSAKDAAAMRAGNTDTQKIGDDLVTFDKSTGKEISRIHGAPSYSDTTARMNATEGQRHNITTEAADADKRLAAYNTDTLTAAGLKPQIGVQTDGAGNKVNVTWDASNGWKAEPLSETQAKGAQAAGASDNSAKLGKQIDSLMGDLKNPDGSFKTNLTGPIDRTNASIYRKTGDNRTGGKNAAQFQNKLEMLQKSMLPILKESFGPQISDSDVKTMMSFYGLDSASSEAEVYDRLNNMKNDIAAGKPGGINVSKAQNSAQPEGSTIATVNAPDGTQHQAYVKDGKILGLVQ